LQAVEAALQRHAAGDHRAPRTRHGAGAFELIEGRWREHGGGLVLDAGCGTGESTRVLIERHPGALVVGVDKSAHRLARARTEGTANPMLVRAELVELWSRAARAGWTVDVQYLLYPNPWPKPTQLGRRWYGHPAFFDMVAVSRRIEARTNWEIYARELAHALERAGCRARLRPLVEPEGLSAFERKYASSGHRLWEIVATRVG
jgi:tRNA G46 methylase TrmB